MIITTFTFALDPLSVYRPVFPFIYSPSSYDFADFSLGISPPLPKAGLKLWLELVAGMFLLVRTP